MMQYPRKLLKPNKYAKKSYFNSYTQKAAIAIATNMEKTYFAVLQVGGIWNSKSKNFVSDCTELLFFNGLFQINEIEPLLCSFSDYDKK